MTIAPPPWQWRIGYLGFGALYFAALGSPGHAVAWELATGYVVTKFTLVYYLTAVVPLPPRESKVRQWIDGMKAWWTAPTLTPAPRRV